MLGERVWIADATISNNVLADKGEAQIAGWFTFEDERHWPCAMQESSGERELLLDKLNLRFAHNVYAANDGQPFFVSGPLWGGHAVYRTLREVQKGRFGSSKGVNSRTCSVSRLRASAGLGIGNHPGSAAE
jgi:hypothetical protein